MEAVALWFTFAIAASAQALAGEEVKLPASIPDSKILGPLSELVASANVQPPTDAARRFCDALASNASGPGLKVSDFGIALAADPAKPHNLVLRIRFSVEANPGTARKQATAREELTAEVQTYVFLIDRKTDTASLLTLGLSKSSGIGGSSPALTMNHPWPTPMDDAEIVCVVLGRLGETASFKVLNVSSHQPSAPSQ
jgi:hypothetical protein